MPRRHKLIRVIDSATGQPCNVAGLYLKTFDHDAYDGRGEGTFTNDPEKAMRFPDLAAAMAFWRRRSTARPTRSDGRPNRPLTVFHCEVIDAPRVHA